MDNFSFIFTWINNNAGVVSVLIFITSILFGWFSGIFSALRKKPKFKIKLIEGPTFCCTYSTGSHHNGYEIHQTGIALYLNIANIGSSASSIDNISVGYHWDIKGIFSLLWFKNYIGWFWLHHQIISLDDFQINIGENIKVYPFLTQKNNKSPVETSNYIDVGQSIRGVVYYEQGESWGASYPKVKNDKVRIKISIKDVFGHKHTAKFYIPSFSIEEAKKYNSSFGTTLTIFNNPKN